MIGFKLYMKANCSFLSLSYISHGIFSEKAISGVREGSAVMHFQKTIRQLLRGERGGRGRGGTSVPASKVFTSTKSH